MRLCQDDGTKPLPKLNVVSQEVVKHVGPVEVFLPLLLCTLPVLLIVVMGPGHTRHAGSIQGNLCLGISYRVGLLAPHRWDPDVCATRVGVGLDQSYADIRISMSPAPLMFCYGVRESPRLT